MTRSKRIVRAAILPVTLVAGCQSEPPAPTARPEHPEPALEQSAPPPIRELSSLDPRRPVPLLPMMAWHQKQNMMEHLVVVQRITDGLARRDWEEIAQASALIETSPQMQQTCQHMGAGAEGFTEMALDFHRRADAIGAAARARDAAAVMRATSNTLQACTGCHAAFRQEIVDAATWQARTSRAHDPAIMHGEH